MKLIMDNYSRNDRLSISVNNEEDYGLWRDDGGGVSGTEEVGILIMIN